MTYLLFHLWLPLLLGVGLGVIGGVAAARHEDGPRRSPFLILVGLATTGCLALAWLAALPGRPGLWVEIAAGFGLAYLMGRLPAQGLAARAMADVTRSDLAPRGDTRVEPDLQPEPDWTITAATPSSAPLATGATVAPAAETKPPAVIVAERKPTPRRAAGRNTTAGKAASVRKAKASAPAPIIEAVPVVQPPSPDDRPAARRPRRTGGGKMDGDAPPVLEDAKAGTAAKADSPNAAPGSTGKSPFKTS